MMAKSITKAYFDERLDKLALAIANGFNETNENARLLKEEVTIIHHKLDNALYKEIPRLETGITEIKKHLKLKTAN